MLFTIAFWKGATERGLKAFAQTLLALLTAQQTGLMGLGNFDWMTLLSVSLLAVVMSLLTSIVNPDFVAGKNAVAEAKAQAAEKAALAAQQVAAATAPPVGVVVNGPITEEKEPTPAPNPEPARVEQVALDLAPAVAVSSVPFKLDEKEEEPSGDSTLPPGLNL